MNQPMTDSKLITGEEDSLSRFVLKDKKWICQEKADFVKNPWCVHFADHYDFCVWNSEQGFQNDIGGVAVVKMRAPSRKERINRKLAKIKKYVFKTSLKTAIFCEWNTGKYLCTYTCMYKYSSILKSWLLISVSFHDNICHWKRTEFLCIIHTALCDGSFYHS